MFVRTGKPFLEIGKLFRRNQHDLTENGKYPLDIGKLFDRNKHCLPLNLVKW